MARHLLQGQPATYEAKVASISQAFEVPPWEVQQQDELDLEPFLYAATARRAVEAFNKKEKMDDALGKVLQDLLDAADDEADESGEPDEE